MGVITLAWWSLAGNRSAPTCSRGIANVVVRAGIPVTALGASRLQFIHTRPIRAGAYGLMASRWWRVAWFGTSPAGATAVTGVTHRTRIAIITGSACPLGRIATSAAGTGAGRLVTLPRRRLTGRRAAAETSHTVARGTLCLQCTCGPRRELVSTPLVDAGDTRSTILIPFALDRAASLAPITEVRRTCRLARAAILQRRAGARSPVARLARPLAGPVAAHPVHAMP